MYLNFISAHLYNNYKHENILPGLINFLFIYYTYKVVFLLLFTFIYRSDDTRQKAARTLRNYVCNMPIIYHFIRYNTLIKHVIH